MIAPKTHQEPTTSIDDIADALENRASEEFVLNFIVEVVNDFTTISVIGGGGTLVVLASICCANVSDINDIKTRFFLT